MITRQILATADRVPDKTAVVVGETPVVYRQLATGIRTATAHFRALGLTGTGVAVIVVPNFGSFWIWSLALRRLGLTVVQAVSAAELDELALGEVRGVLVARGDPRPGFAAACERLGYSFYEIDMSGDRLIDHDEEPPFAPGGQILKTSGTTGTLKKVLVEPDAEELWTGDRAKLVGLTEQTISNIFAMGPWTAAGYKAPVGAWSVGATIVVCEQEPIWKTLRVPGLTSATLTPMLLDQVLAAPEGSYPRSPTMLLRIGGGPLTHHQISEARRRITPHLFNLFGSTEAGVICITPLTDREDYRWHQPAPGTAVEIVDDEHRPVAMGGVGRLRVRNDQMARYFDDETLNRTFFHDGFFYPGDFAQQRADGRIALHGRFTDVINVRGAKASPAALERHLSDLNAERTVCLFSMQNERGEEKLICAIEGSAPVDEARLSAIIEADLGIADTQWRYVETMPRNANGKVVRHLLRKALADPA